MEMDEDHEEHAGEEAEEASTSMDTSLNLGALTRSNYLHCVL